ncbi:MAG TPA: OmpA family protein [Candidatus Atribacteria bacterium]|nr:OmpA family protein [Candidatus Atribacteria bacterium]
MSKRKQKNEGSGSPGWMTTYSDLVTLLLTFFVMLFAFSSMDADKFRGLALSLQAALNSKPAVFENQKPSGDVPIKPIVDPTPTPGDDEDPDERGESRITIFYKLIKDYIEDEGLDADISLHTNKRGVIIEINEHVLFDPGKAVLKESSKAFLDRLVPLLVSFDNNIIVEGHTDDVPMTSPDYPTNWELSTARATSVVRYYHEQKGIEPERLSAIGYGEYHPIVPNNSDENRALNRSVNLLIEVSEQGDEADGED